jgi:predicted PurR-regulated permease PerM
MTPPNQKASLGCGTLILIALIVMIFSNANRGNDSQITSQIQNLSNEVNSLKNTLRTQSESLTKIQKSIDEMSKRTPQPRPRVVAVPGSNNPPPAPPEVPLPDNP